MGYDVFISSKSQDYEYARDVYQFLTGPNLNYKVFLADSELRKKGVAEYGEVIDEALDSAEHLILFLSKAEYAQSSYVKNEWRTFLEEKRSGRKSGNILTILKDVEVAALPISLRHFQSFSFACYKGEIADFLPKAESALGSTKTYKVGDYYDDGAKQGVVFEVTPDGKHGKIVSLTESQWLEWMSYEYEQYRLIGADDRLNGAYNMAKVKLNACWRDKYLAFAWCADLGEDWYLPAVEELEKFTLNDNVHEAVNRTLIEKGVKLANKDECHWYWSSTEVNHKCVSGEYRAFLVDMDFGDSLTCSQMQSAYVRAVAQF